MYSIKKRALNLALVKSQVSQHEHNVFFESFQRFTSLTLSPTLMLNFFTDPT